MGAYFGMRSRTRSTFHRGMMMVGITNQTGRMHEKCKPYVW